MHQNIYDHEKNERCYKHYAMHLAYVNDFKIFRDGDAILKLEDNTYTEIVSDRQFARNTLWFRAWKKLKEQYDPNSQIRYPYLKP